MPLEPEERLLKENVKKGYVNAPTQLGRPGNDLLKRLNPSNVTLKFKDGPVSLERLNLNNYLKRI